MSSLDISLSDARTSTTVANAPEVPDVAPSGFLSTPDTRDRSGRLHIGQHTLETPYLFPVASLITGTTARGGGLWKYVLHAHTHSLMRRQLPLMTQVLHFLDFGVSPRSLGNWRATALRTHYNTAYPDLQYSGPLFLDSGGFKLLWTRELDVSSYGIEPTPASILHLQRDLGGELIATLDYPLPPGLVRDEATDRMQRSLNNALATIRLLRDMRDYRPALYVAAHGQDGEDIRRYVGSVIAAIDSEGWPEFTIGLAIGSLVPLRGAQKIVAIIDLVRGAIAGIPERYRARVPVHVFGMTGNLVPLLVYLGVDTFDSSTYAQEARGLGYIDPLTHKSRAILEMEGDFTCTCRVCQETTLQTIQAGLTAETIWRDAGEGHVQKSRYYADIALHNLEMDRCLLERTRQAVRSDSLPDLLRDHAAAHPQLRTALAPLAAGDQRLQTSLTRTQFVPAPLSAADAQSKGNSAKPSVSARYTPASFDVLQCDYWPPPTKRIALLLPCSGGKPYSSSRSHRLIAERLSVLGEATTAMHKITLSGLYGPVPEEFETLPEVLGYDFRLDPNDSAQIALVTTRIVAYVERFGSCYMAIFGYATSKAYRTALERAARRVPALTVLPATLKARRLSEFFRQDHIAALVEHVRSALVPADFQCRD